MRYLIRDMVISSSNQVWIIDITCVGIQIGFLCLVATVGAYSRRAVGCAISARIDTALISKALHMATIKRHAFPGMTYHPDQHVQYASGEYVDVVETHGFEISMLL